MAEINSLKSLISTPDGQGVDEMAVLALALGSAGVFAVYVAIGLIIYEVVSKGQPFSLVEFGAGIGALLASVIGSLGGLAALMGVKAKQGG